MPNWEGGLLTSILQVLNSALFHNVQVIHQELQLLQDMLAMAASSDREVFQNDHKESQYSMAYVQSTANPIACSGNGKDICG